jgi:hypothetical protein
LRSAIIVQAAYATNSERGPRLLTRSCQARAHIRERDARFQFRHARQIEVHRDKPAGWLDQSLADEGITPGDRHAITINLFLSTWRVTSA